MSTPISTNEITLNMTVCLPGCFYKLIDQTKISCLGNLQAFGNQATIYPIPATGKTRTIFNTATAAYFNGSGIATLNNNQDVTIKGNTFTCYNNIISTYNIKDGPEWEIIPNFSTTNNILGNFTLVAGVNTQNPNGNVYPLYSSSQINSIYTADLSMNPFVFDGFVINLIGYNNITYDYYITELGNNGALLTQISPGTIKLTSIGGVNFIESFTADNTLGSYSIIQNELFDWTITNNNTKNIAKCYQTNTISKGQNDFFDINNSFSVITPIGEPTGMNFGYIPVITGLTHSCFLQSPSYINSENSNDSPTIENQNKALLVFINSSSMFTILNIFLSES